MAVDSAGNLYVTDFLNNRVVKLAAGSTTPVVLPFTGLHEPGAVAVDAAGDLYVTDGGNHRVVKLAAGSSTQTVLPLNLNSPTGVAVDSAGNLYISDPALYISDPGRDDPGHGVLKLAAGSTTPTVLWSEGNHSSGPGQVAVATAGDVYFIEGLSDTRGRVLKLPAG
jgi:serine/threonine protein kinase, bacterial